MTLLCPNFCESGRPAGEIVSGRSTNIVHEMSPFPHLLYILRYVKNQANNSWEAHKVSIFNWKRYVMLSIHTQVKNVFGLFVNLFLIYSFIYVLFISLYLERVGRWILNSLMEKKAVERKLYAKYEAVRTCRDSWKPRKTQSYN